MSKTVAYLYKNFKDMDLTLFIPCMVAVLTAVLFLRLCRYPASFASAEAVWYMSYLFPFPDRNGLSPEKYDRFLYRKNEIQAGSRKRCLATAPPNRRREPGKIKIPF
jgi:hypothetical protein